MKNNKLMIILAVLILFVAGVVAWLMLSRNQEKTTANNAPVKEQQKVESKPKGSKPAPDTAPAKNIQTTMLKAVGNYSGSATATRTTEGAFTHEVVATIGDPAEGKFYEGWLAGPNVISTGKMQKEADGTWSLTFTSDQDLSKHNQVVITEETEADGLDGRPEAHVLEGMF